MIALAALACYPLDDWRPVLAEQAQVETVRALVDEMMVLVFVAPSGAFSMFLVDQDLTACMVMGGAHWSMVKGEPA